MYVGLIAKRYSKALYDYATEKGAAEAVYAQAEHLAELLTSHNQLIEAIASPVVSHEVKLDLLEKALPEGIVPCLKDFLRLVMAKEREKYLLFIVRSYLELYRKEHRIIIAKLTCAAAPSKQMLDRIDKMTEDATGCQVEIVTVVDPSLIGGFIFRVDDRILDNSVRKQIRQIERSFEVNNNRIV